MEKKDKKPKNTFKWLFWILLALIIIGGAFAFIFRQQLFDAMGYQAKNTAETLVDKKDQVSENTTYVYSTDEQELYDLMANYIQDPFCGDGLEFGAQSSFDNVIFSNKSHSLSDVSKSNLANIIFWYVYSAQVTEEKTHSYSKSVGHDYITKDELQSAKEKLLGKKFDFDATKMAEYMTDWKGAMNWDEELEVLHFPTGFGGTCVTTHLDTIITKALKVDDKIELYARKFGVDDDGFFYKYKDGNTQRIMPSEIKSPVEINYMDRNCHIDDRGVYCYNDNGDKEYVKETDASSSSAFSIRVLFLASDWRKANLYKVTFEQDPDNKDNYIFKSSEILE